MAFKETRRKGFNFFRSYFDVYNELESDKDKVSFINALLNRQFLGIKPTDLKGMAKFAYISQTNSIDSQVKGYEDKTGDILTPCYGGRQPPTDGGTDAPSLQVEVKQKVKGKDKRFTPPSILEVKEYFKENGYTEASALKAFNYYEAGAWKDSKGQKVKSWKQKMQGVWFKDENKIRSNGKVKANMFQS